MACLTRSFRIFVTIYKGKILIVRELLETPQLLYGLIPSPATQSLPYTSDPLFRSPSNTVGPIPLSQNYGYVVDQFLTFCADENVPEKFQLPADEFVLSTFAASRAGVHSGSMARNNIATLKAWHVAQNQPWKGGSRLHYVLPGSRILHQIHLTDLQGHQSMCGMRRFWGPMLACQNSINFWQYCCPCTQADPTFPVHIATSGSRHYAFPTQKQQKSGEDVVLVLQMNPIDSDIALHMHLKINDLPESSPLLLTALVLDYKL
ncbi:hypothetical protein C8R45DRAFT_929376 [Mycena sanguinolenta]|nr:hypothetical protein C8R45DRAFT_929376 [Mycena sanguinolenta]